MRRLALLAAVLMIAGLTPATALAEEHVHSDNMTFLGNLGYDAAVPDGTPNYGTDIEFADLEVPKAARNGKVRGTETRPFALAGTYDNGLQIVDISDHEQVSIASVYDCGVLQGDVQVFTQDGRTYATYTSEDTSSIRTDSRCVQELAPGADEDVTQAYGTYIVDVTDPYDPVGAAFISVPEGSHNGSVHPSGDFFYNSNAALIVDSALPAIEIYDIADLATRSAPPRRVGELPLPTRPGLGTESHDITFNTAGDRAYSAALSQTVVINSTNPARPTVVSSFIDETINVEHQADPVTVTDPATGVEREFLLIEDEVAGALPTGQCPSGGVHVYEITGTMEANPVKVGFWNIDEVRPTDGVDSCTAHVFDLHEDAGIMTIAYYNGGVRVVDLNGLAGIGLGESAVVGDPMTQIGHYRIEGINSWSAKTPEIDPTTGDFTLYSNDINRGLDVFRFEGELEEAAPTGRSASVGRWMTPAEAKADFALRAPIDLSRYRPFCLLAGGAL